MTITVSTDGSALGNPNGPMGWGWADHELATGGKPGHHHDSDCDAGGATNGTNQIGELCAVLEALRAHPGSEPLVIETDSQYAINCSTTWVHGWKKNGWKNSQKKPVKNADLIRAIDAEISKRPGPVKFVWVKGHAGNAGNEKVDELARTYAGDCRSKIREGYLPLEGWQSLLASEYSQGTDVPDDAQMLLDGKITTDEYHMGRGQGKSAQGSLADDLMGAADPEPRPRSIADMLVEPEGYPAPDEATLPLTSNEMPVESDDMPEPTTALDTTMPDGTTPDAEAPRKSYAEMLLKPDCFPHEHASRRCTERTIREFLGKHAGANERISRIRKRVGANERRRRFAETAASRQSFGIGGVGHHSLHSPAKFQSDVRRQATPDPRLHRGGRLRARRRHARPRRSAICSQAQLTSQHFRP